VGGGGVSDFEIDCSHFFNYEVPSYELLSIFVAIHCSRFQLLSKSSVFTHSYYRTFLYTHYNFQPLSELLGYIVGRITVNHPDILWGVILFVFSLSCRAPHGRLYRYFSDVWTVTFCVASHRHFALYFFPHVSIIFRASERWVVSTFCLASHRHFALYFFRASLDSFLGRLAVNIPDILSGRLFCTYWPCGRIRIHEIHLTQWMLLV
jgi:hypothetical protein